MLKLKLKYGDDLQGFYWPESEAKRKEYFQVKRNSPAIAEAVYQANPGALEGEIFKKVDFRYYKPPRRLMDGIAANLEFVAVSDMIVQAWDTAFSAKKESDYSVCITAMLVPCNSAHTEDESTSREEVENHYDIYILEVLRERLDFKDLVPYAERMYKKWRPSYVLVEKKASGEPLMSQLDSLGIPTQPVEPGIGSKRGRAVHGVKSGSAQGWVQQHRVWFPIEAMWLPPFEQELKNFSGNEDSFDDQVDAFVHLCNFAITQGADAAMMPSDLDADHYAKELKPGETMLEQVLMADSEDPFKDTCAHCIFFENGLNWCRFHRRPTVALDHCENFQNATENYPND